ncbi:SEC14-like protein 4 [Folsomia candida]|uniref:CRAL-TRIO domain-containing protein n=1 Tax=Folsomia candida TaxID=158441 RepID=A0A226EWY6_FOLCA|nr:SEC14-like protein 4 [Folsomia candida]OXA61688.1 hypothetical protein Fcan01_00605 [Folsomia candida]
MANFLRDALLCCAFYLVANGITVEQDMTLTNSQAKILEQFKSRLQDKLPHAYMRTDFYLIKWLLDSNYQLDLAEEKLLRNLKWRKDEGMDDGIHYEDWSDIWDEEARYSLDGRDKQGRPLLYVPIKHLDFRSLVISQRAERFHRYVNKAMDEACSLVQELYEKHGNISRGMAIFDLEGFNLVQHGCFRCLPHFIRMWTSFVDHWPKCVGDMFLINAPEPFVHLLNIAKPFSPKEILENLHVFGSNKNAWKAELRKYFDPEQLSTSLGGTKTYDWVEE